MNQKIDDVERTTYVWDKQTTSSLNKSYKCRITQPSVTEVEQRNRFGLEQEIITRKDADIKSWDRIKVSSNTLFVKWVEEQNGISIKFKKLLTVKDD